MKDSSRQVLELLRQRGTAGVTPMDALAAVGCFRLGARIWDLKADGYPIDSELITTPSGKRVARYRLIEQPEQLAVGF